MLSEAKQFWDAISGKIKSLIKQETANTFRCERYEVTTAPNGTVIGVTKAFGEKEILLPYSKEVASAIVGQPVLVVWWGSMSNAKVYYYANGYMGASGGGGGGEDGATFIPSVSEQGIISWTNNGGLPNPTPRNIMGPTGDSGVYVGETTPSDPDVNVWIDPEEDTDILRYKSGNTWHTMSAIQGDPGVWYGTTTPPAGYEAWVDPSGSAGWGDLLEVIYPVGSIYMSMNSTNPGTWFGGTWEQIEDTFLLAAGQTYAAGATGGSATNSHTHYEGNLKAAIGATGGAPISIGYSATDPSGRGPSSVTSYTVSGASWTNTERSFNHYTPVYGETAEPSDTNNMPPYLAVYMWRRTA